MRKILVAGGAGYIGSHVCKALAAAGCVPVAYDNLVRGHAWAVKWGPLIEGDIADTALLKQLLRMHDIHVVMHLAAYAYVGESMQDPRKYFRNNVAGTISLLDAMVATGTRCLVLSSTCATCLRKELNVFGTDYPTPDGTAIRDYIHVADLAAAHVAALHYLTAENRGVALNLGTGHGHSVREVIRQVERVAGRRVPTRNAPPRPGDPPVLVATSERAAQLLAWRAQHSDLATIVQSAWHWHRGRSAAPAPKIAVG